jgi:hypothetical protein
MKSVSFAKRAVALAVLSTAAIGANAAIYDLGVLSAGAPKSFNAFTSGTGLQSFDDSFSFSLLSASLTSGSVLDFALSTLIGSQFTSAALYSGTPNSGSMVAAATGTALPNGRYSELTFANAVTPAGSYYLRVAGVVTPGVSLGAGYSGALSVTAVTPVPEPESYAMFLAGLGVMGAIAVRRNKAKKG